MSDVAERVKKIGVEIPDDQAETIVTVGDAVKFLEKASAPK
jgi:acyl carrier protein